MNKSQLINKPQFISKLLLVISGVVLVGSLIAVITGRVLPDTVNAEETLVNYTHQGEFSCTAFAVPADNINHPVALLYPRIIESLDMLVTYSAPETESLNIRLFIEDQYGGWRKEIPLQVGGGPLYSFPLDIKSILELGAKINNELGGRNSNYLLDIVASGGTLESPFSAVLRGTLTPSTLAWNQDGFYKIEKGFPGDGVLRSIAFGYRAQLGENSLLGPILMEGAPWTPGLVPLDEKQADFTGPAEYVDIGYSYRFVTDTGVRTLTEDLQIEMQIGTENGPIRTVEVLPWTRMNGNIDYRLPLDVGKLSELVNTRIILTDTVIPQDAQITLTAKTRVTAETDRGNINEIFTHSLTGTISRLLTWNIDSENRDKMLMVKSGAITRTARTTNGFVGPLRIVSLIALAVSTVVFIGLLSLQWKRRTGFFAFRSYDRRPKKYGELISEVGAFPPVPMGNVITGVSSLDALAKISNNTLKPILMKVDADRYSYRVIDGPLTFEYVSSPTRQSPGMNKGTPSKEQFANP